MKNLVAETLVETSLPQIQLQIIRTSKECVRRQMRENARSARCCGASGKRESKNRLIARMNATVWRAFQLPTNPDVEASKQVDLRRAMGLSAEALSA